MEPLAVVASAWTQRNTEPEVLTPLGLFVRDASAAADRRGPQRALVTACARIAHASAAVILVRDSEEAPERLHFACEWRDTAAPVPESCFHGLSLACPRHTAQWSLEITHAVAPLSSPLDVSHVLMLPSDQTGVPKGAVVLLATPSAKRPVPELSSAARARAAEDLLQYGWPLVERLDETFAQTVADGLRSDAAPTGFGSEGVRELLEHAAILVHTAIGADQVFAQFGADIVAYPPDEAAVRVQAESDGISAFARQSNRAIRILDMRDTDRRLQARVHEGGHHKLLECLGWDAARSVIVAPIDRDLGMLKVYTRESGRFLTPGDLRIVQSVGERLRAVASPLVERAALHELNRLASKLAGLSGEELARQLVSELEAWAARYLKTGCQIYILAQTEAGEPMVAAGSVGLKHVAAQFAEAQSQVAERTSFGGFHVLRASFILPKGHGLTGALFLCHKSALTQAAEPFAREAAREIALLLHAESVRQTLLQQQGFLRHGLLGPVQGLMSNALSIGEQLESSGQLTDAIRESLQMIKHEAAAIRAWRSEHRLVACLQNHKRLDIRTRRSQLRVFVENCVDRFRYAAQERNLTLHLQLPPGGVLADFDPESLDIALSNLMDNAIKYAFYNREISVGMRTRKHAIDVWVEDVGHGIPEQQRDAIYESGTRGGQIDPFRVIRGEGLGLYLVRQIAAAHDGTLTHTCELAGKHSGDTTPYRVRFTLSLPGN